MELLENPLIVSLLSLIVGAAITAVVTCLRNKTGMFRFSVRTERAAVAVEDPMFGSIKVTWQGQDVKNLYASTITLENTTSRDFENIGFTVFTGNETFLLSESTIIEGVPDIIQWSPEFKEKMSVPEGQSPSQAQFGIYNHRREYLVPVMNRGQKLRFTYLCSRPVDDQFPLIFISTLTRGIKLKYTANLNVILNVPVHIAALHGVVITVLVAFMCALYLHKIWLVSFICATIGLFAQFFGAVEYKIERRIKAFLTG